MGAQAVNWSIADDNRRTVVTGQLPRLVVVAYVACCLLPPNATQRGLVVSLFWRENLANRTEKNDRLHQKHACVYFGDEIKSRAKEATCGILNAYLPTGLTSTHVQYRDIFTV